MARFFINADEVKITSGEAFLLNLEFYDGTKFENVEARRLFPITGPDIYISLLDDKGSEIAVVRNINNLMAESADALKSSLEEYYMIPKISKITDRSEKYGVLKWTVETDRGIREFEIRNRQTDIKVIQNNRVLIKDSNDNRYEIVDFEKLDKSSLRLISTDL